MARKKVEKTPKAPLSPKEAAKNGAPLATANLCENVPVIDWCVFKL